jgi:probable phosphoglycerate mutase
LQAAADYPSPVTLLLLVRHAVTDVTGKRLSGNQPGLHLSDRGRAQAGELSERLRAVPLAAVYSSPLERCMETAEIIAAGRSLPVQLVARVREVEYGRWTGRPIAQLAKTALWKRIQHSPSSIRFPDGETLTDVQRRSTEALEELATRHRRKIVAVVSHADVIRMVLAHYAGVHLDLFQRLIVSPASVSAVLLGDRVPRILRMNDTGTLDDLVTRTRSAGNRARPSPRSR